MPLNITADTPRNKRSIGSVLVDVPAPYAEGHTITAGEAQMLNQTLAENFSNNLRKKVQEFVPAGSPEGTEPRAATAEEAQALVDEYAAVYEPGVRRSGGGGGRATLDPVEKEMRVIARESLNDLLKRQGLARKEVDYNGLLDQIIEEHGDKLRAKAEKIVKQRDKDDLDLDVSLVAGAGQSAESEEATA